jgi:hypothetical protein
MVARLAQAVFVGSSKAEPIGTRTGWVSWFEILVTGITGSLAILLASVVASVLRIA